jgi:hypothetical protein
MKLPAAIYKTRDDGVNEITNWPAIWAERWAERAGIIEFQGNVSRGTAEIRAEQDTRRQFEQEQIEKPLGK